jgi:hypothetical protein
MSGDHNMFQKPRSYDDDTQYDEVQVQAMIKKAVRDEREACAKVCDVLAVHPEYASDITKVAAQAIRARGEKLT